MLTRRGRTLRNSALVLQSLRRIRWFAGRLPWLYARRSFGNPAAHARHDGGDPELKGGRLVERLARAVATRRKSAEQAAISPYAPSKLTTQSAATPLEQLCDALVREADELRELRALALAEDDHGLAQECEERLHVMWDENEGTAVHAALADPGMDGDCFLEINSGEGGVDSMDWCRMVGDMYSGFAESRGLGTELVAALPGQPVGYSSMTLHVTGIGAFGLLAPEAGAHRLIRHSPFDRKGRRHTSFAVVLVLADTQNTATDGGGPQEIPRSELRIETMRASGAGGQSVNMNETAVRMTHLPTGVSVKCQRAPSQIDNMKTAMKWLAAKLRAREEAQKRRDLAKLRAEAPNASAAAEQRVRTYTLHPRELVKDTRLGMAVTDAGSVLAGEALQTFLDQGVLWAALERYGA